MLFLWAALTVDDFAVDLVCDNSGCGFDIVDATANNPSIDLKAISPSRWWLVGAGDSTNNTILQFSKWMTYASDASGLKSVKFTPYAPRFEDQSEAGRAMRVFKIVAESSSDAVAYVRMRYGP